MHRSAVNSESHLTPIGSVLMFRAPAIQDGFADQRCCPFMVMFMEPLIQNCPTHILGSLVITIKDNPVKLSLKNIIQNKKGVSENNSLSLRKSLGSRQPAI